MLIGRYVGIFVIAPKIDGNQQNNGNQTNGQNSNSQNTDDQSNNQNNDQNDNSQNNNQNGGVGQGLVTHNDPGPSNPTAQYTAASSQFALTLPSSQGTISGTMAAVVECAIQVSGNNVQLPLDIIPQNVSQGLEQIDVVGSTAAFNLVGTAGTASGPQLSANAQGTIGSDTDSCSSSFDLNLSGSFGINTLTLTITSTSDSPVSISSQPITLQSS